MLTRTVHLGPATHSQSGFSLIELAIVLMIVGTLMGGVLVAIGNSFESGRRTSAQNQMRQIEDAIYGFAQITGRLPCPTTAAALIPGTEQVADPSDGTCSTWFGFIPAATLGLFGSVNANGLLLDPWQNPYRYAVAQFTVGGAYVYTHAQNLRDFYGTQVVPHDNDPAGDMNNMITVSCEPVECDPAQTIIDTAPAIILSMGPNWATTASAVETENADGDQFFAISTYSEDNFDDQLLWLSPYVLFNRMVSAGRLP